MKKLLIVLLMLVIAACSLGENGSKFLGTWQSVKNPEKKMIIKRDNSDFLVLLFERSPISDNIQERIC